MPCQYRNHRHIRHDFPAGIDSDKVCRIVERGKVIALLDCLHHLVIDDHGGRELLAAVYDTVSDCINFVQRLDDAVVWIGERVNHKLHCYRVVWHRCLDFDFVLSRGRVREHASVNADAFAEPLCKHCLGGAVNELVLE